MSNFRRGQRGAHKNAKSKARGIARRAERRARAEALLKPWRALTIGEQLSRLPKNGAKKQRARILARMKAMEAAA